jgi:hypothetical protein
MRKTDGMAAHLLRKIFVEFIGHRLRHFFFGAAIALDGGDEVVALVGDDLLGIHVVVGFDRTDFLFGRAVAQGVEVGVALENLDGGELRIMSFFEFVIEVAFDVVDFLLDILRIDF